ncbi:Xaa-Pro dipeptidase [Halomonas sp. MCCC 1A17488]|uniref:Xaa-Pro dipeptidase n=1 Tax=Billgrantia sulfidoxydans TaxID=2733484 RepID=A0ABX7W7X9_9GAMM|nr:MULTISPECIES: Xaa-Pro dipeptidase [Halomonas]MCE8015123.1 Xaa-Pro dipeptidase [Halomonas sp. MCCC 1A17488]MCG3238456.1 Xaa-Pro dipeptidase [Halomonas sp. MCCC 1A17488]QPP47803.1 Xaa-Pro dipeptidase [Halomonas sp. SS10-MC5]QTP55108.1 Xaa-Pro dipeptidase [Halomonas sulfidoxydans]
MADPLATLQQQHLQALERHYVETLAALGYDGVLIYSGRPALHFGDDQYASFCSYGHFQHWTGQAGLAHSWLLIRPGRRPVCYLHAPDDFWHLPAQLPDEAWTERLEVIPGRYDEAPPIAAGGRLAVVGDVSAATSAALGAELNPAALLTALDEGRVRKSDYEVACLGEANRMAGLGHRAAREAFLAGGSELDVHLAYLQASRQRESELPYGNIVGSGAHAAVLHYQHYDTQAPRERYSLLVDAGHRHRGYCADITRTWAGADAEPLFGDLVAGMHDIKQRLVEAVAPGVDFVELHERMHCLLGELLVASGLVTGSAETAVESGITRAFCPHGLGHLLGIQVHDVAGRRASDGTALPPPAQHPALRLTRELEAGMAVTIEPGLYVIPMLLEPLTSGPAGRHLNRASIERLAPHGGIRIEDNVVVTANSARNLTADIE